MVPIVLALKFLNWITGNGKVTAIVLALVLWFTGIIKTCMADVVSSFAALLDSISIDQFKNVSFASVEYIGYVNAIIPLSEFVALMTVYLTAWGIVIALRWIKSFIPTIGN